MSLFLAWARRNSLLLRFTGLSLVAFFLLTFLILSLIRPAIERFLLTETERQAVIFVNRNAEQRLVASDFDYPPSDEAIEHITKFVDTTPVRGIIEAILYDPRGNVLYPKKPLSRSYAKRAAADEGFLLALFGASSPASFRIFRPDEEEAYGTKEAFVVYIPITVGTNPEPIAILHTISRTGLIRQAIDDMQREVARRLISGLAILYVALAVIVWGASRTIMRQSNDLRISAERIATSLKRERELSSLKDKFLATASHQLKTPVSEIGWAVETLRDKTLGADATEAALASVENGWRSLQSMVGNLLTASEIGFRYEKKNAEDIDTFEITEDVLLELADIAKRKDVRVRFMPTGKEPIVNASKTAIGKVLRILIDNAITYSNDGGEVDVTISIMGGSVIWRIKDTGIGIVAEDQPKIFEQFFRGRNAIERKNVGSGLGLFIAKNIVEGHGGSIGLESEVGKGTTFWFSLPIS